MTTALGDKGREVVRTNPWWRQSPGWEAADLDLRQAASSHLDYRPGVLDDLQPGALYILRGPRRVGKTVSTKQAVSDLLAAGVPPLSVVRVAADGWADKDVRTIVQNVALPPVTEGQTRYWLLDEITGVTGDWASQVKWLRDNDPSFAQATVILTGSDAGQLSAAAGTLAGRRGRASNVDRTLLPMGFRTFAALWHSDVTNLPRLAPPDLHSPTGRDAYQVALPWLDDLVRLWETYLLYGGFPVAVAAARAGQPVPEWFIDALFDVIHRDSFGAGSLDAARASSLLSRLWASVTTPANLSSIARDIGVTPPTVARHVNYLRHSYLLWRCPQLEREWIPKDRAADKLYPIDPLLARLGHLRNAARDDMDPTAIAEAQIAMALRRAALRERPTWDSDSELFYVRTATRNEIDFVSEIYAGAAVEVKYTDGGGWRSQARTVEASAYRGVLATRSVLDTSAEDGRPWAVPAALLAVLLDT